MAINEDELKSLSLDERMKAMEAIWDTFIYENSEIESPGWHGDVLGDRKARIRSAEARYISLEDFKKFR